MKAYLTRRYMFSASHRLHNEAMSAEENVAIYGKCNNPYGHGHNYTVEVTVSGKIDAKTGMVCNLADLDKCVKGQVIERYDHQNLNLLPDFKELVPSTENLCVVIYDILKREFSLAHLERVKIEETMKELKKKYTIVIVTHNLQQARRVADMTAFFYVDTSQGSRTGYLVEYDHTEAIFNNPRNENTRQYISGKFG